MIIYIALLRGINVGGKNMIKMAELKRSLEAIDLNQVQTYIQSGNVLFESNEDEETLKNKIEQKIVEDFGLSIPIVLRTSEELEQIIHNCPFSLADISKAEMQSEGESMYVALLAHNPLQEKMDLLSKYKSNDDAYQIEGREVYLLFSNSIRNSKLANNLQKLEVPVTVRNWKTMNKLVLLAKAMEE